jgi:tight adherence protein B
MARGGDGGGAMIVLLGLVLAAGILLVVSPWLWPAGERAERVPTEGMATRLLEAGGFAHVPPRVLVAGCACAGLLAGAVAWLVTGVPALAAAALAAGAFAPIAWLRSRRLRLARERRGLWPDVCDLLIASVRAGMSLPDAVAALADSAPAPLRGAFAAFGRDMAASGHFDSSADRLKHALADPLADRIVETLRMARQVGGTELVPVLRALSASVRAEAALRGEVESRQSWTRGAAVLGVVAPWVIVALLAMRPEGATAYSSPEGVALILAGAIVSAVAYRLMLRIGRLPEPSRWFA